MSKSPVFISGNLNKVKYLEKSLGMKLEHHELDLHEIQSADPKEVIEHKVRQAYEIMKRPVLVEDTILCLNALNGLPGPFIKFFVQSENGLEHICHMLDGFEDRSAYGMATYGYFDGTELRFFGGRLDGEIVDHPRGTNGYGWDQIFEPETYRGRTRAELNDDEYIETYKVIRNTDELKQFLTE